MSAVKINVLEVLKCFWCLIEVVVVGLGLVVINGVVGWEQSSCNIHLMHLQLVLYRLGK
jgi:hypothetical protein